MNLWVQGLGTQRHFRVLIMKPSIARQLGRTGRQALGPARRAVLNQQLQHNLSHLQGRIGSYWALPEEANPGRHPGWYLPCLQDQSLVFRRYQRDADCQPGALNIPVPIEGETLGLQALDWVLVPLTAFDRAGTRVGMGGGYYDRTLGQIPRGQRIGIAFDAQCVGRITPAAWDQPLGAIVTPSGWIRLR